MRRLICVDKEAARLGISCGMNDSNLVEAPPNGHLISALHPSVSLALGKEFSFGSKECRLAIQDDIIHRW